MAPAAAVIDVEDVAKAFTLHNQGGAVLHVIAGARLRVAAGEGAVSRH